MNNYFSKCSFCGKKASALKQPKEWLLIDMSGYSYTNLQACEQCARFVMVSYMLSEIMQPHKHIDMSFLQSYFPDFKKLEDTNI